MTELERYKQAQSVLFTRLNEVANMNFFNMVAGEVDAIINPPPVTEDIEVSSWCTVDANGSIQDSGITEEDARDIERRWATPRYAVKLTGTYTRPVPQNVERSAVAEDVLFDKGHSGTTIWPHGAHLIGDADWGSIIGKRVKMVLTWEE